MYRSEIICFSWERCDGQEIAGVPEEHLRQSPVEAPIHVSRVLFALWVGSKPAAIPVAFHCLTEVQIVPKTKKTLTLSRMSGLLRAGSGVRSYEVARRQAKGKVVPATAVDHFIPHRGDLRLF